MSNYSCKFFQKEIGFLYNLQVYFSVFAKMEIKSFFCLNIHRIKWNNHFEKHLAVFSKVEHKFTIQPNNSISMYLPKGNENTNFTQRLVYNHSYQDNS